MYLEGQRHITPKFPQDTRNTVACISANIQLFRILDHQLSISLYTDAPFPPPKIGGGGGGGGALPDFLFYFWGEGASVHRLTI